ncbi:LOW QUALITY PROTEIN: hypothetical protein Q4I28_002848 [Leishmania naiffi]|uniref:Uncharacterized protein n=1 Tax=Leishmania naiffi TaxID=5678 RepID=A0AAW3BY13_9TRYP
MHDSSKMQSKSVQPSSADSANPLDDAICARVKQERRAALFKMWVWSLHLQQALGAALCLAPPESVADFSAAVKANMLAGDLCSSARLTPVAGARGGRAAMLTPFGIQRPPRLRGVTLERDRQPRALLGALDVASCSPPSSPSFFLFIGPFLFSRCGLQLPPPHPHSPPPLLSVFPT